MITLPDWVAWVAAPVLAATHLVALFRIPPNVYSLVSKGRNPMIDLNQLRTLLGEAKPAIQSAIMFAEFLIPGADGATKKAFVVTELAGLIQKGATAIGIPTLAIEFLTRPSLLGNAVDAFVAEMNALGLLAPAAPASVEYTPAPSYAEPTEPVA